MRGAGTLDKSTGSKDFFFASTGKRRISATSISGPSIPVLVSLPGSTGPAPVVTSKDGNGFILDTADLGKGPARHLRRDDAGDERAVPSRPPTCPARRRSTRSPSTARGPAVRPRPANGSAIMGFAIVAQLAASSRRSRGARRTAWSRREATKASCWGGPARARSHLDHHRRVVGRAGLVHGRRQSAGRPRRRERRRRVTRASPATAAPCASGPRPLRSRGESWWPPTASSAPGRRTEAAHRPVTGVTGPRRGRRRSWLESGRPSARPSRYEIRGSCP